VLLCDLLARSRNLSKILLHALREHLGHPADVLVVPNEEAGRTSSSA
jgi:hypothetical protein